MLSYKNIILTLMMYSLSLVMFVGDSLTSDL